MAPIAIAMLPRMSAKPSRRLLRASVEVMLPSSSAAPLAKLMLQKATSSWPSGNLGFLLSWNKELPSARATRVKGDRPPLRAARRAGLHKRMTGRDDSGCEEARKTGDTARVALA